MPNNKNQMARIKTLNECFSLKGSYWSIPQLIDEILEKTDIVVKERTVELDIQNMRTSPQLKYNAPIAYCKSNKGYHYTDPNYSTDKIPLNKTDIKSLELAASTLKQYQYIPIMTEFTATIDKIIRVVNRAKQSNHASILDFIEFEKTPVALGIEHIDTIIDAVLDSHVLDLVYQKFGHPASISKPFHPYFLKEYRNRWYVIGLNGASAKIQTYGLDRIIRLTKSKAVFIKNTVIDSKEYLGRCVGINLQEGLTSRVVLRFSAKEGHYLKTQALHKSQEIIEDDPVKGLTLKYELIINYEFTGILLGYGSDVVVLEPKSLADKIVEISKRVISQYEKTHRKH
jgi:predicted DNA-binding transcriptional regulator YafY